MTDLPRDQLFLDTARATMRALGMEPDPWQLHVLTSAHKRLLLNCCRQAGKSTTVALLSVLETVGRAGTKVLIVAPSLRQSRLLFKTASSFLQRIGQRFLKRHTLHELNLVNLSQIICLPCKEETIRGYADVYLMIIDEAARVPEDIFKAVTPMLAVSDGRLICLSTPYGRRGFFYHAWAKGGADWQRIEVPVQQVPRIGAEYLDRARREMGESWFRQEFCCSFEALEGLVYPDFARCVVAKAALPAHVALAVKERDASAVPASRYPRISASLVGGLDFGLRNPFAAVWGFLDRDDVLWLVGEHYARDQTLAYHAQHLPRGATWYGDPSGARETKELICAGFAVRKGDNDRPSGIAAVRARLETGTLKVLEGACPNLLAEAKLYRYDPNSRSEDPMKENDHVLDALRYLISKLDWKKLARMRKGEPFPPPPALPPGVPGPPVPPPPAPKPKKWLRYDNEALWTPLNY